MRFDHVNELRIVPCFALKEQTLIDSAFLTKSCVLYSVINIINLRPSYNPLRMLEKNRMCVVDYELEYPNILKFDRARNLVIDAILKKKRYRQGGENVDDFKKRMNGYKDMSALIMSISLYGETWY